MILGALGAEPWQEDGLGLLWMHPGAVSCFVLIFCHRQTTSEPGS